MIVHEFDVLSAAFDPTEADTILIVDAYAVLPGAISAQRLKAIAGRYAQIRKLRRDFQLTQLASGDLGDRGESTYRLTFSKSRCQAASERQSAEIASSALLSSVPFAISFSHYDSCE